MIVSTVSYGDSKTDEKSFQEMIEGFVAMRPRGQVRHFPRFPTAAALAGQLGTDDHDGVLVSGATSSAAGNDPLDSHFQPGSRFSSGFHVIDFSEKGFQLQFRCDHATRLLDRSLSLEILSMKIPVVLSWFKQSQPFSRGGVSLTDASFSGPALMKVVTRMGENLVHFLIEGLKAGRLKHTEQAAVFAFLAIFYTLRLHFLQDLASVWDLAQNVKDRPNDFRELEGNVLTDSGFRMGRWEIGEIQATGLDPVSAVFMKPYYEYGSALIGLREDTLFLEDDALAVVKRSVLLPTQRRTEKVQIPPRFRLLYQSLLGLRNLCPGTFQDVQLDFQFGYYCTLIKRLEVLGEELVYKAYDNDPFDNYAPRYDTPPEAPPDLGARGETPQAGYANQQRAAVPLTRTGDKVVKVFTHSGKPVVITCPECSNMTTLPGDKTAGMGGSRRVKCSCGLVFTAFFERRRSFRKVVSLHGRWKPEDALDYQPMVVKDVSRGGLSFEALAEDQGPLIGTLAIGVSDTVQVEFRLDNEKRALIHGKAAVRTLMGSIIKAEFTFLDAQVNKELGFYFM
jgi:hypothetical protein